MSENLKTPTAITPCRRMGLSRNFSKTISPAVLSPMIAKSQIVVDVTPKSAIPRTFKSVTTEIVKTEEGKLLKQTLDKNGEITTSVVSSTQKSSLNTGYRYRLSLNKRIRDKISKKKIDFVAHAVDASEAIDVLSPTEKMDSKKSTANILSEQIIAIKADIANKKRKIAAIQTHNKEIEDLEAAICLWKGGFQQAMQSFQSQLTPAQDVRAILQHLNIPLNTLDN